MNTTRSHTASTTITSTPRTSTEFEPACMDSRAPASGPQTSAPIASAKPVGVQSNSTTPTANVPTSAQRKLAHPVSDTTLLLVILAHISPPACIYIVLGAGCSFVLNLAITEMHRELGTLHAWYLLYMFSQTPDASDPDNLTQRSNTGTLQPAIQAWHGGMVGEWPKMLLREFQGGFQRGFQKSFETELQRRPIRIEVQYSGIDDDQLIEDNYDKIAGSLRDLSKEMAEALEEMKELLAKVRLELRML